MSKTLDSAAVVAVANEPRWKNGWKDSKGNQKSGFWYLYLEGRKVSLTKYGSPLTCTGKKGTKQERQAARDARDKYLEQLPVQTSQIEEVKPLTVRDVCKVYQTKHLPSCKGYKGMNRILEVFLDGREKKEYGCLPFAGCGEVEWKTFIKNPMTYCEEWEEAHPNWSSATRANSYRVVIAAIHYAMSPEGGKLVESNPLAGMKFSIPTKPREYMSADDEAILRKFASPAFLAWFDAALATGCRPMEIGIATTEHVKRSKNGRLMIVLPPALWKNGKKLNRCRVIPLPDKVEQFVAARCDEAETAGKHLPILTTSRGGMWSSGLLSGVFNRTVEKALKAGKKINPKLSSYSCRHTFITRALLAGKPIAMVAKACGTSAAMIERRYSHLADEHEALQDVVDF